MWPGNLFPVGYFSELTEYARLAFVKKIHQWSYLVVDPVYFNPDQSGKCCHWYNNVMNVMEVTNHFLFEFERYFRPSAVNLTKTSQSWGGHRA